MFILIQTIIVIIMLEIGLHAYFIVKHKINPPEMHFESLIGWQNTENLSRLNSSELWGEVIYTTKKYGFRNFSNTKSNKMKILFIGDSFTMADNITDGRTYYNYIQNNNENVEIFAYGGGGYGSLQEYLILDQYLDEIDPDMIIWQFCDNDLINNDNNLEGRSLKHRGIYQRPYLIDGKINVLLPWKRHGKFYNILQKSYLVKLLSLELQIFQGQHGTTIEDNITKNNEYFQNSVYATKQIMNLVQERIDNTPLISFNAKIPNDFPIWWSSTFNKIAKENNFIFLQQITDSLNTAVEKGIIIDGSPVDAHWNVNGHEIVGKVLLDYLVQNNYIDK